MLLAATQELANPLYCAAPPPEAVPETLVPRPAVTNALDRSGSSRCQPASPVNAVTIFAALFAKNHSPVTAVITEDPDHG